METTDTPQQLDPARTYLAGLRAQKLIVRGVKEHRATTDEKGIVLVAPRCFVDVITVVDGRRVSERFDGVTLAAVARLAKEAGHTVVEQDGNIT